MSYKFLEDIAIADVAFEATGKNLEELFVSCALATTEVMVDLKDLSTKIKKEIKIENKDIEILLYEFLSELIFLKDAESLLFSKFDVKIKENKNYELAAKIAGDKINPEKQELKADVKAVTMHMFEVKKIDKGWKARIILDI
jgi:SHS2 domain-containing protein